MRGSIGTASVRVGRVTVGAVEAILRGELPPPLQAGMATILGVVATDAVLTKAKARKLAQVAHDGLALTVEPAHTMWDGDTLFALGTGRSGLPGNMTTLGVLAGRVTASTVLRAVLAAKVIGGPSLPDVPAASDPG